MQHVRSLLLQKWNVELFIQEWRCVIDPGDLLRGDADAPVLPLQSNALSGALHPAPAQHGSEVLGPRAQDCPRNPIKAGSCMSDPPSLLIFQMSCGGPVCVFKWLWSDMPEDRKLQCVFCFLWRGCLYSPWLITNGLSLIWKYAAAEVFIALN